jgi:hypothetical protein
VAELHIRDTLWREFVAIAEAQQTQPTELAEQVLRDFIQRLSDEELLAQSERATRRAGVRMQDAEQVVRDYRRRKA